MYSNNFPFAVIVPCLWKWPLEQKNIRSNSMTGYPRFANWMATNGASDADWYNEPNAFIVSSFEEVYEKIEIPALLIQVITGFWMGLLRVPTMSDWFDFSNPSSRLLGLKVIYFLMTVMLAMHARLRIIPKLESKNLLYLAVHIAGVTFLAILFSLTGLSFRTGWI